jgi:hypothetical protein
MDVKDFVKGAALPLAVAGLGLAAAPWLLRRLTEDGRPVAKALLHKYLDAMEDLKEASAEAREQWRDLMAEVQAEREAREAASLAGAMPTESHEA